MIDFLSLLADDKSMILNRPRWNKITGSVTGTILLQQIIYRWIGNKRKPFYKFNQPCDHRLYTTGDSWLEELGFTRRELETARKKIAAKTKRNHVSPLAMVSYWPDADRKTWYALNETAVETELSRIYSTDSADGVGMQPKLMAESAISSKADGGFRHYTNGGIVHYTNGGIRHSLLTKTTQKTQGDDIVASCLDSIGFVGDASKEPLNSVTALSWLYYYWLNSDRMNKRGNATAMTISLWKPKAGKPVASIPADLLRLANWWLAADDDQRRTAVSFVPYGGQRIPPPESIHDCPIATLSKIYRASGGNIAPPALMPEPEAAPIPAHAAKPSHVEVVKTAVQQVEVGGANGVDGVGVGAEVKETSVTSIRRQELSELGAQTTPSVFGTWLAGTNATLNGKTAVIHTKNEQAADWLNNRLKTTIERALNDVAGRPYAIVAEARKK